MILDRINLNYLRIFESVYRTKSMTQAALEMHLTQSGISQHIKSLEEALEVKLFDRIKQKLVPTLEGQKLFESVSTQLKGLEQGLLEVTSSDQNLRGRITIGMPVVFGLNIVIPLLTQLGKKHSDIQFDIRFDLAHNLNQLLLSGEVDFAFVDDFPMDSQIKIQKVYNESLQLCCSKEYYKNLVKKYPFEWHKKFFQKADYLAYQRGEPIIRRWLSYHLRTSTQIDLNVKVHLADALGISRFINRDFGFGILPRHHVEKIREQGHKIHVVESKNKDLLNKISVAYVQNRTRSTLVQTTLNYLNEEIKNI